MKLVMTIVALLLAGCAVRQPFPSSYRLVKQDDTSILIPPGVASANLPLRKFTPGVMRGTAECSEDGSVIALRTRGKRLLVTVRRDALSSQQPGWLSEWAAGMEARKCIATGSWWDLANRIAESVPLDERKAFRLRYAGNVDIGPQVRIQVDSPILQENTGPSASYIAPMQVTEIPGGLRVEMKSADNVLGYERAWYGLQRKQSGGGFRISPLSAERHLGDAAEQRPQPEKNYLSFPAEAGYYRLVYKQQQTEFTALVVAGRTRVELDQHSAKLEMGDATCQMIPQGFCLGIPRGVAVNLFLPVTVNGKEVLVYWGAGVGDAIGLTRKGQGRTDGVLATLAVSKPHNGQLAPVEFSRSETAILGMRLTGGETISWH